MSDPVSHPSVALADIRNDYRQERLCRDQLLPDPLAQFHHWMQQALERKHPEPTAMSLATATPEGRPLVRTVLLKGLDERGFVFFTNLESRKSEHLLANPHASLLFPWLLIERQVVVCGRVERTSQAEDAAYFGSRPRESRLAAWASSQSRSIANRAALEASLAAQVARFGEEGEVPLPPFWGGFRVIPETIEFWQGGSARLHDRFEYTRQPDGSWTLERLCP